MEQQERYIKALEIFSKNLFGDEIPTKEGVSIMLRVWSGCLWTSKTIAIETRNGLNTAEERKKQFEENIRPRMNEDKLFELGARLASRFKKMRGEPTDLDGVPSDLLVKYFKV